MIMTHMQTFQNELENEALTTRKMLALVPNDKYDWKPHPKSMTIKQLATHIADIFSWFNIVLITSELDFASNPYQPEDISSTPQLLTFFEKKTRRRQDSFGCRKGATTERSMELAQWRTNL